MAFIQLSASEISSSDKLPMHLPFGKKWRKRPDHCAAHWSLSHMRNKCAYSKPLFHFQFQLGKPGKLRAVVCCNDLECSGESFSIFTF